MALKRRRRVSVPPNPHLGAKWPPSKVAVSPTGKLMVI